MHEFLRTIRKYFINKKITIRYEKNITEMTGSIDMPCVISINELQLVITIHASMLFIIKSNHETKYY